MLTFLARHWFLVMLATGAALACLVPGWFGWAERLDPRAVVTPALFLMAWTLPSRSLARVLLRPLPALWAVTISYGMVPMCGWLAGMLVPVEDFRIGLLIVVCAPCTLASAVLWTRMGGGDDATALLVILLTTGSSWLVTPAWLALTTGRAVAFDTFAMMKDLLLCLVVPVGLGQLCRAVGALSRTAARHKLLLGIGSQLLILLICLKAAAHLSVRLRQEAVAPNTLSIMSLAVLCLAIHLLALGSGLGSSRVLGFAHASQVAVAFACSQKSLPVGLLVLERYFSEYPLAVMALAFYFFGQLLVDTVIADRLTRRQLPLAA